MADSKLGKADILQDDDLVQCGICFAVLDKPKALPCLHTYCQHCLSNWADSSAKKTPERYTTTISCPDCREEFPLPKGGVKELKTNFFVNKLKERTLMQKKLNATDVKITCTSCDITEHKAIGRCVECDSFLCKQCVDSHKLMKGLRHHHVLTLEELRAGKLKMHNFPEQEICPKHPGEVLRFYCETCNEPMCRDCTVLDHPRPDHKQIDLKSAAAERSEKLKDLFSQTDQVRETMAFKRAVAEDHKILKTLESNAEKAIKKCEVTARKAVEEYTKRIEEIATNTEREIAAIVSKRKKKIEAHQESLQFQNARLRTALEMTSQVTENGSEHDIAIMYSSLTDTMQQLSKLKPKSVHKSMGKVDFTPDEDLNHGIRSLGVLKTYEQWTLDTTFGQFRTGRAVVGDTNDIMIATYSSGHQIKVFGDDGVFKRQVVTSGMGGRDHCRLSYPWGMVLSPSGDLYITDQNPYVKVINGNDGSYKNRFCVTHPNGQSSQSNGSLLHGLATDSKGHLYVGCTNHSYISICDQNGTHVSCFKVNLQPWFIAVADEDHIIVSSHNNRMVHVYDTKGTQCHTFDRPPEGNFYPTGLCVVEEEVFVASYTGITAVYRYTLTGKYIGIVTKEVTRPWGLMINDSGERLVVCDENNVKTFKLE